MAKSKSLTLAMFFLVCTCVAFGQVQYKVIYNFGMNGGISDGFDPFGGPIFDSKGNMYGVTYSGGVLTDLCPSGCGTVYKLSPNQDGTWTESVIHSFIDSVDGMAPNAGLISDAQGNFYGTTSGYGNNPCYPPYCGTVFELTSSPDGNWTATVLYAFTGQDDGNVAGGPLTFDPEGNLYGDTAFGGTHGEGTVFELSPPINGDAWTESTLYNFCSQGGCKDGSIPALGVSFNSKGNLFGAAETGGAFGFGGVFRLSPTPSGQWVEDVVHSFDDTDGNDPTGEFIFDSSGNLYGTTYGGGNNRKNYCTGRDRDGQLPIGTRCGSVFEIQHSSGDETSFFFDGTNGGNPLGGLVLSNGTFYGATTGGGRHTYGSVFRLRGTKETVLHSFSCGSDGARPDGLLALHSGRLYGTTTECGAFNQGVVFEISP